MKITYIYHSCFLVELEHHVLLFDYYKGELPTLNPNKPLYVFASHRHQDHFHPSIFSLCHPNITYILSDDIVVDEDVYFMGAHQKLQVDDLLISTLSSTDEGVAFIVCVDGKTIYHAGDLNWWDWGDEDSEEESQNMKKAYQGQMELLAHYSIDVAFVPVDVRLQANLYKGLDACMRQVDIQVVFPMHFWEDYKSIEQLRKHPACESYKERIKKIQYQNQSFLI